MIKKIINSSLFKTSVFYTFFSILNGAISFFLLPILTRFLTPEDYGILALFNIFVSISSVFIGLNIHGAVNRVFFDRNFNFKKYVGNSLLILCFSFVIFFLFSFLFRSCVEKFFSISFKWIVFGMFISFFNFIILILLSIYQANSKAKSYGLINLALLTLNVSLSLILVIYFNYKWDGVVLSKLIATFFIGILSFYIIYKRWIEFKIDFEYMQHALKFGLPLIPHALGGILLSMSDRIIIEHLLDTSAVGIYTVGLQIGSIVTLIASSFNKAYIPWLFDKLNKNNIKIKIKIVKFTYLYFIVILFFALLVGLVVPSFITIIVGQAFSKSSFIIIWIALGGAFNGMYYMVTNYIFFKYKTYYLTFITFIVGVFNVFITYYLVKFFGIKGAAYAFSLVMFIQFILTWVVSMKVYVMPWDLKIDKYFK